MEQDEARNKELALIQERYNEAVTAITDSLSEDINVIAVILYGSLSYDKVWEKSDIDLEVILRDQKVNASSYCLDYDGIVVNLNVTTRSNCIKYINRAIGGQAGHSFLSKGRILYTKDDSLYGYLEDMQTVGQSDMEHSALQISAGIIGVMDKVEKWLRVKNDVTYSRYYLLKLANEIACLEVCLNKEDPGREAILRAHELNPQLIDRFYYYPMNNQLTETEIYTLLKEADEYLESHIDIIKSPVIEYLSDGEPKTMTMLTKYFHVWGHFIVEIMDYLCQKNIIDKVSQAIRITPKGRKIAEEIAYIYVERD